MSLLLQYPLDAADVVDVVVVTVSSDAADVVELSGVKDGSGL